MGIHLVVPILSRPPIHVLDPLSPCVQAWHVRCRALLKGAVRQGKTRYRHFVGKQGRAHLLRGYSQLAARSCRALGCRSEGGVIAQRVCQPRERKEEGIETADCKDFNQSMPDSKQWRFLFWRRLRSSGILSLSRDKYVGVCAPLFFDETCSITWR